MEIRTFAEIDSTNRYLLDQARAGAPSGLVAVADHQLAGRGRHGRRWEAPAGANLLVSVLWRPGDRVGAAALAPMALALAAGDACEMAAGLVVGLKWPNDLVVGERKLGGVLGEWAGEAAVIGLGLNLAWPPPDPGSPPDPGRAPGPGREVGGARGPEHSPVPGDLARSATSLWRESGIRPDRDAVLDTLLVALEPWLAALETPGGRSRLVAALRQRSVTVGREVAVELPGGRRIEGRASSITDDGHLVVELPSGSQVVSAGDVVHLRAR